MAYDVLIKNGKVIDGSGMPAFAGDVAVKDGKIAEIGKLSSPANKAGGSPPQCKQEENRWRMIC